MNRGKTERGDDPSDAAIRAAGAWIARQDRGLTADEKVQFSAWLRADPRNEAAFARLQRTSDKFDRLREIAPPAGIEPDPDALAPRLGSRRRFIWIATAALAAAAVALLLWSPQVKREPLRHYVTASGGYERVLLSDGSVMELNGDTAVDVQFTPAERSARLSRGEAHFRVAKNPARPFYVTANSVSLRVVGTAFDVRLLANTVEVLVTDGVVEVKRDQPASSSGAGEAPRLTAGQKLIVPTLAAEAIPAPSAVARPEIDRLLAWQSRIVEFSRTPLRDAVNELNRYSAGRFPVIVINDDELGDLRIGGNFRLDQPEAFVRLLESGFGISVERSADRVVLKKAR